MCYRHWADQIQSIACIDHFNRRTLCAAEPVVRVVSVGKAQGILNTSRSRERLRQNPRGIPIQIKQLKALSGWAIKGLAAESADKPLSKNINRSRINMPAKSRWLEASVNDHNAVGADHRSFKAAVKQQVLSVCSCSKGYNRRNYMPSVTNEFHGVLS